MTRRICTLIIVSPNAHGVYRVRISPTGIALLLLAGLISFLLVVEMGYNFPPTVNDLAYAQLSTENQKLKVQNKNLRLQSQKLSTKVAELLNLSERIDRLLAAD